jgi:S-DNA-T family DNA segregation ATPase FtsK/SpoIIIE
LTTIPNQETAEPVEPARTLESLTRRLPEAAGLTLALVGCALALLLASYEPAVPDRPATSLFGHDGVRVTEWLFRRFGLSPWLLCPFIAAWGWRVGTHRPIERPVRLIVAIPLALVFAMLAIAAFWRNDIDFAAGTFGDALYAVMVPPISSLTGFAPKGVGIVAALLALATLPSALGSTIRIRATLRRFVPAEISVPLPRFRVRTIGDAAEEPQASKASGPVAAEVTPAPRKSRAKAAAAGPQTPTDLGPVRTWKLPPLDLLAEPPEAKKGTAKDKDKEDEAVARRARKLEAVLLEFGVKGEVVDTKPGPVITLFEYQPAPGVKASQVIGLADDIARSMSAASARVSAIPGRTVLGIEIPNKVREAVALRELLESKAFTKAPAGLVLALGKNIGGDPVVADLVAMPHLLIAGTTGSGKSVGINSMILSLLYRLTPNECRFLMVDPKMLELAVYGGIPHLLAPVVTDPLEAVAALRWAVREMELRYKLMSSYGVRNIAGFNAHVAKLKSKAAAKTAAAKAGTDEGEKASDIPNPMPNIVIVVDEIADLMLTAGKDVETAVQRITQMARAAGIHLVMATQRPSADVITGTIKANFPTRISFQVTSKIDSRTILGEGGAELLLGKGDMLYAAGGGKMQRVHGAFVSDDEIGAVADFLKAQGEPNFVNFDVNGPIPAASIPPAAPATMDEPDDDAPAMEEPEGAEDEDEAEEVEIEAATGTEPARRRPANPRGGRKGRKGRN